MVGSTLACCTACCSVCCSLCCSVLQCVAVCCSVLQCVAVYNFVPTGAAIHKKRGMWNILKETYTHVISRMWNDSLQRGVAQSCCASPRAAVRCRAALLSNRMSIHDKCWYSPVISGIHCISRMRNDSFLIGHFLQKSPVISGFHFVSHVLIRQMLIQGGKDP